MNDWNAILKSNQCTVHCTLGDRWPVAWQLCMTTWTLAFAATLPFLPASLESSPYLKSTDSQSESQSQSHTSSDHLCHSFQIFEQLGTGWSKSFPWIHGLLALSDNDSVGQIALQGGSKTHLGSLSQVTPRRLNFELKNSWLDGLNWLISLCISFATMLQLLRLLILHHLANRHLLTLAVFAQNCDFCYGFPQKHVKCHPFRIGHLGQPGLLDN